MCKQHVYKSSKQPHESQHAQNNDMSIEGRRQAGHGMKDIITQHK